MSKKPVKCIYCGEAGVTKEHLWGRWSEKTDYYKNISRPFNDVFNHQVGRKSDKTELTYKKGPASRNGTARSFQLKIVCKDCNSGWMSDLIDAAKPLLVRLETGDWWNFSEDDCKTLAAWATMFTMTYEFADKQTVIITKAERHDFRLKRIPPSNFIVLVGRCDDTPPEVRYRHRNFNIQIDEKQMKIEGQVTSFNFGKLFLQVVSGGVHAEGKKIPIINCDAYSKNYGLLTIWPPSEGFAKNSNNIGIMKNAHKYLLESTILYAYQYRDSIVLDSIYKNLDEG